MCFTLVTRLGGHGVNSSVMIQPPSKAAIMGRYNQVFYLLWYTYMYVYPPLSYLIEAFQCYSTVINFTLILHH